MRIFNLNNVRDETESWNGTNWTEVADLTVAIFKVSAGASNTAALSMGGSDGSTFNLKQM